MDILVTGFGPFADAQDNASGHLAEKSEYRFQVLEVAYRPVDDYFHELARNLPDVILLLGVDVRASKMRLETVAHNTIGPKTDVRGEAWGPGPIDPLAPGQLSATLWTPEALQETKNREPGYDAGGYLCNFSFFRAVQTCPEAKVGFIHVPPFTAISERVQLQEIQEILDACLANVVV
jgi:pyrrolidone-carboxylate peptidase